MAPATVDFLILGTRHSSLVTCHLSLFSMHNVRHAFRQLAKTPGFTATALATLALCLGANLTIFAVVDAILVRSLPFSHPDRLVAVFNSYPGAGVERASASIPN